MENVCIMITLHIETSVFFHCRSKEWWSFVTCIPSIFIIYSIPRKGRLIKAWKATMPSNGDRREGQKRLMWMGPKNLFKPRGCDSSCFILKPGIWFGLLACHLNQAVYHCWSYFLLYVVLSQTMQQLSIVVSKYAGLKIPHRSFGRSSLVCSG